MSDGNLSVLSSKTRLHRAAAGAMETSKRKHAEDLYYQAKKPRLANHDSGFSNNAEGSSPIEASENSPVFSSSLEVEMPDDLPSTCSTNERAIILYKPTNPELFLSKPIPRAPAIQLDMKFFTKGLLGPESLSASDTLQQLEVLRSTPATVRVMPKDIPDNRFAVIPWVASSSNMPATGLRYALVDETTSQISSEATKGDEDMGEDALESEAMDEDGVYEIRSSQPINPTNNFGTEPWQHYGVPQPQLGSVTWSH